MHEVSSADRITNMSRFLSKKLNKLTPYTPGEQPKERTYIKLNTNESPFPPSPVAQRLARQEAGKQNLYPDPTCSDLVAAACEKLGIEKDQIIFSNGSDEVLNYAFIAFCDKDNPAVFPDITYGFYKVFADVNCVPYSEIPVRDDFSIDINDYIGINKTIFIANPNAITGINLPLSDIEKIVAGNPDNMVIVDEAYVDFGGNSAIALINKYPNLLVTQTFSKSRSLAGARLGFGVGCKDVINDLNTIKYSNNPYNINRMTMQCGIGALCDDYYFSKNCQTIIENRSYMVSELKRLGFILTDSAANFVLAKHPSCGGKDLYLKLKEKGILVRHFDEDRIKDFNRITVGSMEEIKALIKALEELL